EFIVRSGGALALSCSIILVIVMINFRDLSLSLRVFVSYLASALMLILGYRILYRVLFSYNSKGNDGEGFPRAIVYGAGEIGGLLARQYFKRKLPYSIIGFVDDDPLKQESMIQGIPVLGTSSALETILEKLKVEELIIGITNLPSIQMQKALDTAARCGVQVQIIPSLFEMEQGRKSLIELRSIKYDDLLGRNPITIDRTPIEKMVLGQKILITGAGGSIGNEICKQLLAYHPDQLLLLDIDETEVHNLSLRLHDYQKEFSDAIVPIVCDVKDKIKLERIFDKYKPDIVFHAA
ncbi:MAG: nucleoside-diphosphate sugar epimerase/dehydratase, partial [Mobilitalea sp.]